MGIGKIAQTGLEYTGRMIFDDNFASAITQSIKHARRYNKAVTAGKISGDKIGFKSIISDSFRKAHKVSERKNPSVWKGLKNSLKSYGDDVAKLWKCSDKGFFSKIGGTLKGLGKRAPLIGAALTIAFELPNIIRATKDGGLINGVAEVGKSGVRLAAGIATGAVLAGFLGPIGLFGGFIVGDWLARLVVGKSHTEKIEEAQQKQQAQLAQFGAQFVARNK